MTRPFILLLILTASISQYNYGTTTASGKAVKEGMVACPYRFKFGQKVEIQGKVYTCQDRTARWVQTKFGDTFDIYRKATTSELLKFGRKKLEVKVL